MISSRNYFLREIRWCISRPISQNSDSMCRPNRKVGVKNLDSNASEKSFVNKKWPVHSPFNHIRSLSTIQTKAQPSVNMPALFSTEERLEFLATYPDLVRDLLDAYFYTDATEETFERYNKLLQYVPGGKLYKGIFTVFAYKMLEKPENLTLENIRLANILGWCTELLGAAANIVDDIVDESDLRRGKQCWYKNDGVGLSAVNDAIILENNIYSILKRYFSNLQCYVSIIELFRDVTFKSLLGQSLDVDVLLNGRPKLDQFTMKRYNSVVIYKTAYLNCYLPVALGMYLSNMYDKELNRLAEIVLLEMGKCFQIQDDFLDVFGDPAITGKNGTDIKQGKCTWLAVMALERANPVQRRVMEEHYGRSNDESINIIKNLYEELNISTIYAICEEERFNSIKQNILQLPESLPQDLFFKILNKFDYRRL